MPKSLQIRLRATGGLALGLWVGSTKHRRVWALRSGSRLDCILPYGVVGSSIGTPTTTKRGTEFVNSRSISSFIVNLTPEPPLSARVLTVFEPFLTGVSIEFYLLTAFFGVVKFGLTILQKNGLVCEFDACSEARVAG